jgi:hypothetical protein
MIWTQRWRDGLAETRRRNELNGVNWSHWATSTEDLLVAICFVSKVDGPRPFGFYPRPDETEMAADDRTTR